MNIRNYKLQLEMLIGAELTGEIELGAMPSVTDQELEKMDEEADLAAAKEQSYEIYAAEQTMKDAEDAYVENITAVLYIKDSVERTLEAAKYTYNASIQDYELRFRMLYAQVQDYRQILSAAQTALACEQGLLCCPGAEVSAGQHFGKYSALRPGYAARGGGDSGVCKKRFVFRL